MGVDRKAESQYTDLEGATMNTRLQNTISSYLSGWFQEDWMKTIVWNENKLYIKDVKVLEEILFNLEEQMDLQNTDTSVSSDPKFPNWCVLDVRH